MLWPMCTMIARNTHFGIRNAWKRVWCSFTCVRILGIVSVSLCHQHIDNRCKIEHENTRRLRILIYVWCFFLLLSSVTTCKLMDTCLVSLRLHSPLPEVFSLLWWWWLFFLILILILVWFLCFQHTHLNQHHIRIQILCFDHEGCSCEPRFF